MPCELLYIIQVKKEKFLSALLDIEVLDSPITCYNAASDWPRAFLQPGCFC